MQGTFIIVSNEIGMGVHAETEVQMAGRPYRVSALYAGTPGVAAVVALSPRGLPSSPGPAYQQCLPPVELAGAVHDSADTRRGNPEWD